MADLRPSQVETLERAYKLTTEFRMGPIEAADLAFSLGIQTASALRRLKGLVKTGHLKLEPSQSDHRRFFSLTNKGKAALLAATKKGGE